MFQTLLNYIPDLADIVEVIKAYDYIVFLGTGGSSLAGQALQDICQRQDRILFFDNIDPRTFREKILPLVKKKTFFVITSKSGSTSEVLAQTLSLKEHLSDNVLIITQEGSSPLYDLANEYKWRVMHHPREVGGRFSAFTIVGLLPCMLLGLLPEKFIKGAYKALSRKENIQQEITYTYKNYPMGKIVLLSYSDYTKGLLAWMSQLIAESLGKRDGFNNPKGIMPIMARGTIDQHSQLQLWLDGAKDQIFQIYFFNDPGDESRIEVDFKFSHDTLRALDQKSYNHIFKAHCLATKEALREAGYHVQFKEYPALDEEILGEIMMEKFIEVFHLAALMEVEPTGQPAVEKAKTLIGHYL